MLKIMYTFENKFLQNKTLMSTFVIDKSLKIVKMTTFINLIN